MINCTWDDTVATWDSTITTWDDNCGIRCSIQAASTNTFKVAAAVASTFQAKAGITLASVVAAINTAMQAKAGLTNVKVASVVSVSMQGKSPNTFKVVAAITNGMTVHAHVTASPTGGNQPAAQPSFVFCDWLGVHRVSPD
jgi:hypothetical protein